ncbi:hypothetical protein HY212_01155 [Candidatus Pacearchaeota archaeon]|nr:hypothetical protein [Candidatus Pacearchaeota archaeon]
MTSIHDRILARIFHASHRNKLIGLISGTVIMVAGISNGIYQTYRIGERPQVKSAQA